MVRSIQPEDAADFWDGRYAEAQLYGPEPTSVARQLAGLFREESVRTVLDAGCGSGRDAPFYFDAVVAIHLIHLQPEPVRRARVNRLWSLARDGGPVTHREWLTVARKVRAC